MNKLSDLLNFKTKKDRDDFLIALAVIFFFGWLIYWIYPQFAPKQEIAEIQTTVNKAVIAIQDTDGDGISDDKDECITLAGIAPTGCPADTDGDGVYDKDDNCPEIAGTDNGCPTDTDGDGISDHEDKCPKLKGTKANKGCPSDIDGDGVYDADDKCPELAGLAKLNGCPEAKVNVEEQRILDEAIQNVEFETGSAVLRRDSRTSLYRVAKIMKKYPDYKLEISGHTDNTGDANRNKILSKNRAQSCYNYFVENGIAGRRMKFKGFGQYKPIDTNDTAEGRERNRRVEFKLTY